MTTLRYSFGRRVAELRRIAGLKQEVFSAAIGLSAKAVGDIERGAAFPKPERLEIIADALKVPLKELFDFSESRYIPSPPPIQNRESSQQGKRSRRR